MLALRAHRRRTLWTALAFGVLTLSCGFPGNVAKPSAPATPWWQGATCYEVFVRSFQDSNGDGIGDLRGLTSRLDYINDGNPATTTDLGATCVWLMPIAESPSYHGYDVTDFFAVERDYGTAADFRELMVQAHRRGIRVILDYVMNHASSQHPQFVEAARDTTSRYRDWFIFSRTKPAFRGPWNQEVWPRSRVRDEHYYALFWDGMPDLNFRNAAVREESKRITAYWLRDMGADGLRIDAARHIIEDGAVQEHTTATKEWLVEYGEWVRREFPQAFTIGEIWDSTSALVPYYPNQMDSYFAFQVAGGIVRSAQSGNASRFTRAVSEASTTLPAHRWAPFLTNHDQNRLLDQLGGDRSKARVAATALLTIPGMPFLYYGEEIGMRGSKPDERIRTPMQWRSGAGGGFTTGTPWQAPQPDAATVTVEAQDRDPASLLNHYRALIHLRAAHPALARGGYTPLTTNDTSVAAFLRHDARETLLVVLNFGSTAVTSMQIEAASTPLSAGRQGCELVFGSAAPNGFSVGSSGVVLSQRLTLNLPPRSGSVARVRPLPPPARDEGRDDDDQRREARDGQGRGPDRHTRGAQHP